MIKRVFLILAAMVLAGCGVLQQPFTITKKEYVVIKPDAAMIAPCYRNKATYAPLDVEAFVLKDDREQKKELFKTNTQSLEALLLCDLQFDELGKWYTVQEKLYLEKNK